MERRFERPIVAFTRPRRPTCPHVRQGWKTRIKKAQTDPFIGSIRAFWSLHEVSKVPVKSCRTLNRSLLQRDEGRVMFPLKCGAPCFARISHQAGWPGRPRRARASRRMSLCHHLRESSNDWLISLFDPSCSLRGPTLKTRYPDRRRLPGCGPVAEFAMAVPPPGPHRAVGSQGDRVPFTRGDPRNPRDARYLNRDLPWNRRQHADRRLPRAGGVAP